MIRRDNRFRVIRMRYGDDLVYLWAYSWLWFSRHSLGGFRLRVRSQSHPRLDFPRDSNVTRAGLSPGLAYCCAPPIPCSGF
jgi:hypothetical protein